MKLQKGFTLIELMIVIAIIAILAAIAIPAYQDFLVRSRVTDMNTQAGACKSSVAEYFATKGVMPGTAAIAGCTSSGTENSAAPAVVAGGRIQILAASTAQGTNKPFKDVLEGKGSGTVLELVPLCSVSVAGGAGSTGADVAVAGCLTGDIQRWACNPALAGGTTISAKFLPAQCRN